MVLRFNDYIVHCWYTALAYIAGPMALGATGLFLATRPSTQGTLSIVKAGENTRKWALRIHDALYLGIGIVSPRWRTGHRR